MNFLTSHQIKDCLDYASGTADRTGDIIDTAGYESVVFLVKVAAVEASGTNSIKVQQNTANSTSGMADLEGTSISIADDDDNQIFAIEIVKPLERYLRLYVDKDTSHACAESAVAILYGAKELPTDNNVDDTVTSEIHHSPAEGTA